MKLWGESHKVFFLSRENKNESKHGTDLQVDNATPWWNIIEAHYHGQLNDGQFSRGAVFLCSLGFLAQKWKSHSDGYMWLWGFWFATGLFTTYLCPLSTII